MKSKALKVLFPNTFFTASQWSQPEPDLSVIPNERNYRVIVKDIIVNGKPSVMDFYNTNVNEAYTQSVKNALAVSHMPKIIKSAIEECIE